MTFKKWYAKNQDKLQEQYEEYWETTNEYTIPMNYDEFVEDKWDSFDGYCEKEEK
jgi:hypothetical protein